MQKMFTLEDVSWDSNLFGLSTTLLSKHCLTNLHQYFLITYNRAQLPCLQILKDTQTQVPDPVPKPSPMGEGLRTAPLTPLKTREIKAVVNKKIFDHDTM